MGMSMDMINIALFNTRKKSNLKSSLQKIILLTLASTLLAGCGGGGGGGANTQPTTYPSITLSVSSSSVYESSSSNLTLTATASKTSDENITVALSTSGTSTEGTDYTTISDITITAGQTTGTATFDPTSDTTYESNNETAIVAISSVSGGSATESGTQSVTITINEYALNSGTALTYNSSNAITQAATTEFGNFNYSSAASEQNPLEVINAHKAYGYGLTGSGKQIAILDSGFWTGHEELDSSAKTITEYGTQSSATGVNSVADHGLIVSTIAAGEDDGLGMQGVAPSANLHLSSYNQLNGNTYYPTHWANATDNASSAVVQNNSWGINYQIDDLQSDISTNGWTNDYGIAQKFNSSGYTANEASATSYITALNNFQDHGVIVYALSNITAYTDADFQAALPVLFSQLAEAWITAVNIEVDGVAGSETYTRKSAPCGSTAQYCLGADGYQVNGGAYNSTDKNLYWQGVSGTSFVAPQISGAVALLAEAFPNHTPAQITDRLLASADNSFFTHTGGVTFGNGVEHGYDTEFGHGIMDIYAALNPITTSAYTRVFSGDSTNDTTSYQLGTSKVSTSKSFGDSLYQGLVGKTGYTYDDLGGGFGYDMSSHVNLASSENNTTTIDISSELSKLDLQISATNNESFKNSFSNTIGKLSDKNKLEVLLTAGENSAPVQSFFSSNTDGSVNLSNYETTYLESSKDSVGVSATYKLGDSRLLVGATYPTSKVSDDDKARKTLVASLEYGNPSKNSFALMTGVTQDQDKLLGSKGSNAFSLSDSKSDTMFSAFKAQTKLNNGISLTGIATIANTSMNNSSSSLVKSANNIKSSSISLIASKKDLFGDDNISLFASQPDRVNSGVVSIRLGGLADSNGDINYTNEDISLNTSGRQLDYGLNYTNRISKDIAFSAKYMITDNLNHIDSSTTIHSNFAGLKYKNLRAGLATNSEESAIDTELLYAFDF
jgi:hypothetical protein